MSPFMHMERLGGTIPEGKAGKTLYQSLDLEQRG